MNLATLRASAISAILVMLVLWPWSAMADSAGLFQVVIGNVKLIGKDGTERAAAKGGSLYEGDRVVTADGALAQVKFSDGGLMSIRANTEFVLDKFSYTGPKDEKPSIFMSLIKGGLRSITGLIGKTNRDGYRISTTTGIIGIRGTDHEPRVILPPPSGVEAIDPPGTYDKVNDGKTFLQTPKGIVEILPAQVGFASSAEAAPRLLPKIPDFYRREPQKQGSAAPADKPNEQNEQTADKPADGKAASQSKSSTIRSTLPAARESTTETKAPSSGTPAISTDKVLVSPTRSIIQDSTLIYPTTSTITKDSTLLSPTIAPILSPTTTTISPTISTILSPTTTTISPTTSTILSPTTTTKTISPTTTTISPLISPTTTTIIK